MILLRYKISLLEVVGVTSTRSTFSVAIVLIASKYENNFVWTLKLLKRLFIRVDSYPIVSDRYIDIMNAKSCVS